MKYGRAEGRAPSLCREPLVSEALNTETWPIVLCISAATTLRDPQMPCQCHSQEMGDKLSPGLPRWEGEASLLELLSLSFPSMMSSALLFLPVTMVGVCWRWRGGPVG